MRKYNVSYRLKELMQCNGLKQVDIVNKAQTEARIYNNINQTNIKFGRNDISQYVSGKVEPSQYKLEVLAKALNVNPVWLMGFEVSKDIDSEMIEELEFDVEVVNALKDIILNKIKNLPNDKKAEVLDQLAWVLLKISKEMK